MEFIVAGASPLCQPWVRGGDLPDAVLDKVTDESVREAAALVASEVLYNLTGRVWRGSGCTARVELDPLGGGCIDLGTLRTAGAVGLLDRATDTILGQGFDRLILPDFPVTEIIAVEQSGTPADPASWRLVNAREIRRTDSRGWGASPVTVTYLYGATPPPAALRAASILAGEFALAGAGLACRLPKRVSSVTRQGVAYTVLDSLDLFSQGRTGVPEVDSFIGSVNPKNVAGPPRVWSPDVNADVSYVDTPGIPGPTQTAPLEFVAGGRFDPSFRYRDANGPIATTGYHGVWQVADTDGTLIETRSTATPGSGFTLAAPGTFDLLVLGDVTAGWPALAKWEVQLVSDTNPLDLTPLAGGQLIRTLQEVPG